MPNPLGFIGGTFTLKPSRNMNEIEARKTFRVFLNNLNRKVYGSRRSKNGWQIKILPVPDRSEERLFNYHCIIESPSTIPLNDFCGLIQERWENLDKANKTFMIRESPNEAVIAGAQNLIDKNIDVAK